MKEKLTASEIRKKIVSFQSLEDAFFWLQKNGKLNYSTARVLSKEVMKRAGINLDGKEVHHKIPLRRGITLQNVLNLNNLQALKPQQHKMVDSELQRQEKPICENKEHRNFRIYKKTSKFLASKYRKFKKDGATIEKKARAFDDACYKLGRLKGAEQ